MKERLVPRPFLNFSASKWVLLPACWGCGCYLRSQYVHLSAPNFLARLLGIHSVEDTIATEHYEVIRVIVDFDVMDFWVNNDNIWVAVILFHLCMAVSECP